jgi:cyclopropane fatty-acyl-phospholipid synthase-like methyltransferase
MTLHLFTLATLLAAICLLPAIGPEGAAPRQGQQAPASPAGEGHRHDGAHGQPPEAGDHGHGKDQEKTASEVDVHRPGMKHDFSDTAKYAKGFDNPERAAWQKPDHVIALMKIEPGMTVVDLGAGTGFFEPPLAHAVGVAGKVLALDVEANMVTHLTARASEAGLAQVEARVVASGDPGLAAASVDRILVVNTWHHIDDRGSYSAKLRAALRPGGALFVVDFEKTSGKGPPSEHKLEPREVIAELEAGGFEARQVKEDLPEQYVVVGTLR